MQHIYGNTSVIMVGHDRGCRLKQRIATNGYPDMDIKTLAASGIVPFGLGVEGFRHTPSCTPWILSLDSFIEHKHLC